MGSKGACWLVAAACRFITLTDPCVSEEAQENAEAASKCSISAVSRVCTSDCHILCCLQLFQAVFGITKKDLLDYIRAGSRGDLLNRRCWFQGRNSKDGRTLSEELEAEDRLEADKEGAGSSTQVTLAHLASLQPRCAHGTWHACLMESAAVPALSLPDDLQHWAGRATCKGVQAKRHAPVCCRQVGSISQVMLFQMRFRHSCDTTGALHLACRRSNLKLAGTCRQRSAVGQSGLRRTQPCSLPACAGWQLAGSHA